MIKPVCELCGGSGYRLAPTKDRRAPRRAMPCTCQGKSNLDLRLAASGIPARYRDCSLENFQAGPGQDRALAAALSLRDTYPKHEKGLLLYGGAGTGKTHLAAALALSLLRLGNVVKFVEFGELLDAIKSTFDGQRSEGDVIREYETAPVLILDDLATRRITEWALDVITRLIDHRYSRADGGLLIVTTNRGLAGAAPLAPAATVRVTNEPDNIMDMKRKKRGDPESTATTVNFPMSKTVRSESLDELLDERLISRLHALCRPILVDGPDRRRTGG